MAKFHRQYIKLLIFGSLILVVPCVGSIPAFPQSYLLKDISQRQALRYGVGEKHATLQNWVKFLLLWEKM